jgi:hypothetical protein
MRAATLLLPAMVFGIAACGPLPPPHSSAAIFRHPDAYAGRNVEICGYLADTANLLEAKGRFERGLSLERQARALGQRLRDRKPRTCLEGKVVRFGCGEEELCLDWAYPWGIIVRSVARD